MRYNQQSLNLMIKYLLIPFILLAALSGCGSSDDDKGTGYINLYNVSANAPGIFLTLDENLDEDDDDEVEITYSSVLYSKVSGNNELEAQPYFIELAWQDEDSNDRSDLEVIYESQLEVAQDEIQFIVLAENILAPKVLTYSIPVIDDDEDDDDDLFNLRFLNLHPAYDNVDIYLSKSDETFTQAQLLGQYTYTELAENQKLEQDEYVFYITSAGSEEVLYKSNEVSYNYASQYVMVIRENPGVSSSPFVLDKVSNSTIVEYPNDGAQAKFRVFNAIKPHVLLPDYQGVFDGYLNGIDESAEVESLNYGHFSDGITIDKGDYSFALTLPDSEQIIVQNHLLTLVENIDRTIFFYLSEQDVDDDQDGDVDENGDGIVDEIEISVNSLVIDNSTNQGVYDHGIQIVNFVDEDDFSMVTFYFVRSDEIIETAAHFTSVPYAQHQSILLRNNTYTIYAIAKDNSSDILLATSELTLDENSDELFLLLEQNASSPTGYTLSMTPQTD
jgi:hypothetical protein